MGRRTPTEAEEEEWLRNRTAVVRYRQENYTLTGNTRRALREKKGPTCGKISAYNAGCKCDDCKDIARRKQNARRRRKREARYPTTP